MPALDRLFAIKGPDHVISLALEPEAQQVYQVAVVIGHHDFHRLAPVGVRGVNKLVIVLIACLVHREVPLFLGNAARQAVVLPALSAARPDVDTEPTHGCHQAPLSLGEASLRRGTALSRPSTFPPTW